MLKTEADLILQKGSKYHISCQIIKNNDTFKVLLDDKLELSSFDAAEFVLKGLILELQGELPVEELQKSEFSESNTISEPVDQDFQITLKVDKKDELYNYPTILVFSNQQNVYKVKNQRFKTISDIIDHSEMEAGEKPIYITGLERYFGYLLVAFENGKMAKIMMESYQTETARKKLKGAYNGDSRLIFIQKIVNDVDLVAVSNINKVVLFNTSQINPVGSRTSMGVQVMKSKDGSKMIRIKKADQVKLNDPEYYRKSEGLNVVGFYLKEGDEI